MLDETATNVHIMLFPFSLRPLKCKLIEIKKREKPIYKMTYEKCCVCGGRVERWDDDTMGLCLDCNLVTRTSLI